MRRSINEESASKGADYPTVPPSLQQQQRMQSIQNSKSSASFRDEKKETYGLNIHQLRKWHEDREQKMLNEENAIQELAVSKVRGFLDAIACVIRIQSWYRMLKPRHQFLINRKDRITTKAIYYRRIRLFWRAEKMFRIQLFGKFYYAWLEETRTAKRLKKLINEFFKICIQRLRLTPQACMAFFNQSEWGDQVNKDDILKIRRLMLEKLFLGWRVETRNLRSVRFKASQILSRMVRRTKGPLWVKESTLVCFHMWHRYINIYKAYRQGLPEPRYTNPFLPQWTKFTKDIAILRIKKKRTLETGQRLTQRRALVKWRFLMTVDRTKPVTPLAVALAHYRKILLRTKARNEALMIMKITRSMKNSIKVTDTATACSAES